MKNLQTSRQANFLDTSSQDSFPLVCLLFATHTSVSKVSLLAGYPKWDKKFLWPSPHVGDPSPGFSASYRETCYSCMLYSSLFQILCSWGWAQNKVSEKNNKGGPFLFLSLAHFFHSSPTTMSLKQASFIPPCGTKLLHANRQFRCITQTRKKLIEKKN